MMAKQRCTRCGRPLEVEYKTTCGGCVQKALRGDFKKNLTSKPLGRVQGESFNKSEGKL